MKQYAGLDVSLKEVSIRVVDEDGVVVERGTVATEPAAIGAFLGLTPRRYRSGEIDRTGRISKCGDTAMRALLYEAATCLIRHVKRFSTLKSWAVRLAGRKGFKKAAVAAARQIAVILLAIRRDGTEFEWTEAAKA